LIAVHYKVFFEVASHLSFSKAAETLYVSQPAVTKQVKKLEGEMGVPLFERRGNVIRLTSSGAKLLTYLRKARIIEKQIESDLEIIKDQIHSRGELRVGSSTTISLYVLPKILSSFRKKFPNVKILQLNRNSESIVQALIYNEIDLAIIEAHHKINAVHFQPFMQDEIIPVCSSHSPFAETEISLDELRNVEIALREMGSGTLAILIKKLESKKIKLGELNIVARLGGTEALKNYLVEDVAIGLLSRLAIKNELERGTLREVNIKSLKIDRKFNFVMRKGEESAGIVKSFIKDAKRHYN